MENIIDKLSEKDSLGDRMKAYEAHTTETYLEPDMPMYARIDGRAFHTLTRGLDKPFDANFCMLMQETAKYLAEKTGAVLTYVQSDEISLGWLKPSQGPFEGRLFKLESVIASMASSIFMKTALTKLEQNSKLYEKIVKIIPTFDCRVFNVPSVGELANAFVWRANDAIKNSIASVAQSCCSFNELQHKNQQEQITMIHAKGLAWSNFDHKYKYGAFYHRVNVLRPIPEEWMGNINESSKILNDDGEVCCIRSEVQELVFKDRISRLTNKVEALFESAEPKFA